MVNGTFYDSVGRTYLATVLQTVSAEELLICRWPQLSGGEHIAGPTPQVCRAKVVSSEDDFDWPAIGEFAGYYIANS